MPWLDGLRGVMSAACVALLCNWPAWAAGPVETSVFAVQGVDIDVTDKDAATAKQKALVDVQVKAFRMLADKQASAGLSETVAKLEPKDILPYLKSLSIEEESVAPGRYVGKFTVRFLPEKIRSLYGKFDVSMPDEQGPPILVIPVWTENGLVKLWEDNPWRLAWQNLRAEQSAVPIIVALGDAEDQRLLAPPDVANSGTQPADTLLKYEALRRRYDVKSIVFAHATPATAGGIAVKIDGETAIGRVRIEKTYGADAPSAQEAANQAVQRFHELMVGKYEKDRAKLAAAKEAERSAKLNLPQSVPVAVPFSSPSQWNGIRARILATPGVVGVEVSSLGADGAVIKLLYRGEIGELAPNFTTAGLEFLRVGETWVIQSS